jgi:hypothetical protein
MTTELKLEHILFFRDYPPECMESFICLTEMTNQDDAFEILTIIPNLQRFKTPEQIKYIRYQIIKYNYIWSLLLLKNNIEVNIVKMLLLNFVDYYYFDIININLIIKNSYHSYNLVAELYVTSRPRKINYYKLRKYGIDHYNAYSISQQKQEYVDKILEALKYNYNDINLLKIIIHFSDEQIRFLKLSRFPFSSEDNFKKKMHIIVNNAITNNFISSDNFELNEKGEFIIP